MAIITKGTLPFTADPRITKVFDGAMADYAKHFIGSAIAKDRTEDVIGGFIRDVQTAGLTYFAEKAPGTKHSYATLTQMGNKTHRFTEFSQAVSIQDELTQDEEIFDTRAESAKQLGMLAAKTQELIIVDLLNSAFDSSARTGTDGAALCDTHTLAVGTLDNDATAAALSLTSLENMVTEIALWKDNAGIESNVSPKKLVVPKTLEITARKIMESIKVPGLMDNDKNVLPSMFSDSGIMTSNLLDRSSTTAYFILTDADEGLFYAYGKKGAHMKPFIAEDMDFDTFNIRMAAYFRLMVGWTDFRAVHGNPGA